MEDTSLPHKSTTVWSPSPLRAAGMALGGGLLGLAIIGAVDPVFKMEPLPDLPLSPSPELLQQYLDARTAYLTSNYALNFGILGACLGGCIGIGTTSRKRYVSGLGGLFSGLVLGAIAGYAAGIPIAAILEGTADQSLLQSTGIHFAIWLCLAVGVFVGIGLIQGGVRLATQAFLSALVAGGLVAVVYTLVASVAFSNDNLVNAIPEQFTHRLVWVVASTTAWGIGLGYGLRPTPQPAR